ncbi:MAG: hypothetical protein LQ352_003187 [Teloschistes flavicans]|nr:MAG: hypothetical protein LQ352_003187 [Teloschistes flavicans]
MDGLLCAPLDIVEFGNYHIFDCGTQASNVVDQLRTLRVVLRPSLVDASSRIPGSAFDTFFKNIHKAPFVASIIAQIITGAEVLPGNAIENIASSSPIITCAKNASGDSNNHGALLSRILSEGETACNTQNSRACYIAHTPVIVLCKSHFQSPSMPAPGRCMEQWPGTHDYAEAGNTFSSTSVRLP